MGGRICARNAPQENPLEGPSQRDLHCQAAMRVEINIPAKTPASIPAAPARKSMTATMAIPRRPTALRIMLHPNH